MTTTTSLSIAIEALHNNKDVFINLANDTDTDTIIKYAIEKTIQTATETATDMGTDKEHNNNNNNNKRVIHCFPMKTHAYKKYKEYKDMYKDTRIGLITGDICINENAAIILCTAEICMQYIFEIMYAKSLFQISNDDIGIIIFEEFEYIFDRDRGYVWETIMIHIPATIQCLMISHMYFHFDNVHTWITETLQREYVYLCDMIQRDETHSTFIAVNDNFYKKIGDELLRTHIYKNTNTLHIIQDAQGKFNIMTYNNLLHVINVLDKKKHFVNPKFVFNTCLEYLKQCQMLPVLIYVFSRKLCEKFVEYVKISTDIDNTDFYNNEEMMKTTQKYETYHEYNRLLHFLKRGIAYYHSGMIPVLRDLVEISIKHNKIKILFATEGFHMYSHIPTVLFTQLEKHDGVMHRYLHNYEYLNMIRRTQSTNIIHMNDIFEYQLPVREYKKIMKPPAIQTSALCMTYNMMLVAAAEKHVIIEDIINKSFLSVANKTAMKLQATQIQEILISYGYTKDSMKYNIASNIFEVHPIIMTEYLIKNCDKLNACTGANVCTIDYIISVLSLWSGIRVSQDDIPDNDDVATPTKEIVQELKNIYKELHEKETSMKLNNPASISYCGNIFTVWHQTCNSYEDCKTFIEKQLNVMKISIGDFIKGGLKLVAIAKELEFILRSYTEFNIFRQHCMNIEACICKYIVSHESLYITPPPPPLPNDVA